MAYNHGCNRVCDRESHQPSQGAVENRGRFLVSQGSGGEPSSQSSVVKKQNTSARG